MAPELPTALVVDDNEGMRYVVGRMLQDAGFQPKRHCFPQGTEANMAA